MIRNACCAWILATLLVFQTPPLGRAETTSTTNSTVTSPTSSPSTFTCQSRSVNYVTHSLPQQCLRTSTTSASSATESPGDDSPSASSNRTDTAKPTSSAATSNEALIPRTDIVLESPFTRKGHTKTTTESSSIDSILSLSSPSIAAEAGEPEPDSPLDNAKFLSFEEWKKQNLAQAGQSADTVGADRQGGDGGSQERRRPGSIHALDSLGEDSEIEIDFGGFGAPAQKAEKPKPKPAEKPQSDGASASSEETKAGPDSPVPRTRSKDAGKTSKERFNYASFDCAANVLKTNPQSKSSSSVLVENKDSYMLNECAADNKFLIVELCDLIWIDTVVLANFEFFSSMFRTFKISVSDRYPVKIDKWRDLGTFEARNSRDIQAFLIDDPPIWARYLRVEFLSHYGSEYYCPLSLIRVHGTTMFEQFRRDQAIDSGELDPNDEGEDESEQDAAVKSTSKDSSPDKVESSPGTEVASSVPVEVDVANKEPSQAVTTETSMPEGSSSSTGSAESTKTPDSDTSSTKEEHSTKVKEMPQTDTGNSSHVHSTSNSSSVKASSNHTESDHTASPQSTQSNQTVSQPSSTSPHSNETTASGSDSSADINEAQSKQQPTPQENDDSPNAASSTLVATPVPNSAALGAPATQESFFKSIHKRLLALEANASLSLQYIESQSQLLRDAFTKVEKRQLSKTSSFLDTLNATVLSELARFKDEYEQLWQSTVLELASQRDEGRRERELLGERVKLLAEEAVNQKRLMAVQSTLLLLCLGFAVFGRGAATDAGLVQNVQGLVTRSLTQGEGPAARRGWRWESPWASPDRRQEAAAPSARQGFDKAQETGKGAAGGADGGTRPDLLAPFDHAARQAAASKTTRSAPSTPTRLSPVVGPQTHGDDGSVSPSSGGESYDDVEL